MPVMPTLRLFYSQDNAYSNLHSGGRKCKNWHFHARYTTFSDSDVFYLKPMEYKCWSQAITFQVFFVYRSIAKTLPTFWGLIENQVSTSWYQKYTSNANIDKTKTRDSPLGVLCYDNLHDLVTVYNSMIRLFSLLNYSRIIPQHSVQKGVFYHSTPASLGDLNFHLNLTETNLIYPQRFSSRIQFHLYSGGQTLYST